MTPYTARDVRGALDALGLRRGCVICVHSSLIQLGPMAESNGTADVAAIVDALVDSVGPQGTVVVPAFNFGFCQGQPFDPAATPAAGMGVLSEHVRTHPTARRSPHPFQSVAAIGAHASDICAADTVSAFDEGGAFARMLALDADLVLFGATIQAASIVHLAEQRATVPYRFWKTFTAPYRTDRGFEERTYRGYVRRQDPRPELALAPLEEALRSRGAWREAPLGRSRLRACGFAPLVDEAMRLMTADPFVFVRNRHMFTAA